MADEERIEGTFDKILGLKNDDDEPGSAEEGAQGKASETVSAEDYNKLKSDFDELKKSNEGSSQKLEQIEKNNEILARIRDVFVPKDPEAEDAAEREKLLKKYDDDPIPFLEEFIENKIAPLADGLHKSNVDRFAKEVMDQIDREYTGINWNKDGPKVAAELSKLTPEYKQKDPKGATEFAMKMAGVGKKRENPGDFPYYEHSTMNAAIAQQRKTEADQYTKGIFDAAKKEKASVLDPFFQK